MWYRSLSLVVCSGILAAGIAVAAQDTIKERQQLMKDNGEAAKLVTAMLKGEKPYDAKEAETAMKSVNASIAKFVTLFPIGTETGGDTAAKPEIWANKAEFESIAKQLDAVTAKAAAAAPGGLDGFKTAMAEVGKACKACHEKFRVEKKK
jgi:cytochrome c556